MRRLCAVFAIGGLGLLFGGCSFPSLQQANSGLHVETNPVASVFIDDKPVGMTPYDSKKMAPGEVVLRLIPQSTPGATLAAWEGRIKLTPGVETIVARDFAEDLAQSSGYTLSLDQIGGQSAAMTVASTPDAAGVKVDGTSQGFAPVSLESVGAGQHEVLLSAPGYEDKLFTVQAIAGYRLVAIVQLAQLLQPAATGSATPSPTLSVLGGQASAPAATAGPTATLPEKPYVQILETPTGWLHVRTDPSTGATISATVNPGQAFPYKDISADGTWYEIEYQPGNLGWVTTQYAKKVE